MNTKNQNRDQKSFVRTIKQAAEITTLFLAMTMVLNAEGYPPAPGPPAASGNSIEFYETQLFVSNPLKIALRNKIVEINAALAVKA